MIVNQQVLRYFETNNLFPRSQFGFRAKRSTFSAIASMHETWIERYQRGQHTAVTFFDLSAAFDTLSKDIFCDKLRIYGFDKTSVEWFNSYLSGRRQVVMIGSAMSEECQLTVGSPQGAILSPTIFIILVADVGLWSKAVVYGYADDTTTTISGTDFTELAKNCEEEAKNIITYMSANKLAANDDKTHLMVIRRTGKDDDLVITVGKNKIKETPNEKLLGMWVQNDLGWSTHLKKLERNLRHRLFNLRRLAEHIPRSLLKTVADGIFMSVLRYGLPIYCPLRLKEEDPKSQCIDRIRVVFNDCLRLLTNKRRRDHAKVEDMLKELGWLSLNQLCAETRLLEAWKSAQKEDYCMKDILHVKNKSRHGLRSNEETLFESVKEDKFANGSFLQRTTQIWNMAPKNIKEATTIYQAKSAIRNYVKMLPV